MRFVIMFEILTQVILFRQCKLCDLNLEPQLFFYQNHREVAVRHYFTLNNVSAESYTTPEILACFVTSSATRLISTGTFSVLKFSVISRGIF